MSQNDFNIKFQLLCSKYFYIYRRRFFSTWSFVLDVFGVVSLWVSSYLFVGDAKVSSIVLSSMGALALALNLVVNFQKKAAFYFELARQYSLLEVELERRLSFGELSAVDIDYFNSKFGEIDCQDAVELNALDCKCYNKVAAMLGCDTAYRIKIPWYKNLTCCFISWDGTGSNGLKMP